MLEVLKKVDYEALECFIEKIVQNNYFIEEMIPCILEEKVKLFSVDVAKEVVVTLTTKEIVSSLVPVLSTAVFGMHTPFKIVKILLEAIRNK